jgi:hypothetical protein
VVASLHVCVITSGLAQRAESSPCPTLEDITECPPEGCGGDPDLNRRKNITALDKPKRVVTIAELQEKANPDRQRFRSNNRDRTVLAEMGEGDRVTVVAWALVVRPGNPESCNCGLTRSKDSDNHIVLVDPTLKKPVLSEALEMHSVTAEFTPRVKRDHPNMTRDRLNKLINTAGGSQNSAGRLKIRVTGQLMFDSEHYFGKPLTRENDWEIHPVVKLEYCPADLQCGEDSDANWKDLESD